MRLITSGQREIMLANGRRYAENPSFDPVPVVKIFSPVGAATWLLCSLDREDPDIAAASAISASPRRNSALFVSPSLKKPGSRSGCVPSAISISRPGRPSASMPTRPGGSATSGHETAMHSETGAWRRLRRREVRTVERLTDGLPPHERVPPLGKDAKSKSSIRAKRKALLRAIVACSIA